MSNTIRWITARFLRIAADHVAVPEYKRPKLATTSLAPAKLQSILTAYSLARESAKLLGQPPPQTEDWIEVDRGVIALCTYADALEAAARKAIGGDPTDGIIALRTALAALDLDPGIRATPLWDPTRPFPWLSAQPLARLCFVANHFAYFTDAPLDKLTADQWDDPDATYAATPPDWTEACGMPRYRVVKVAFDGPWLRPWEGRDPSMPLLPGLSVRRLNAGEGPWLRRSTQQIHAGATIAEFADQIRAGGGSVYMATHPAAGPFQ